MSRPTLRSFVLVVLSAHFAAGCGSPTAPMPAPYPVAGTVLITSTNQPYPGGAIVFQPATDSQLLTTGVIRTDGTFSLVTTRSFDQQKVDGAPEGDYRVMIRPLNSADPSEMPFEYPRRLIVKAEANVFILEVSPPKRGRTPR